MFIHKSLDTEKFKNNKKLNLLKNKTITLSQFLSLVQADDPFIIIGNTIIDKTKANEFIHDWKDGRKQLKQLYEDTNQINITTQEIINNLDIFIQNYPEFKQLYIEFDSALKNTACQPCTKNKYLYAIIKNIHDIYKTDNRPISDENKQFIFKAIKKYYPLDNLKQGIFNLDQENVFDLEWIKSNNEFGLGYDIIDGLTHCFECVKKHLTRAKILFEEMQLGYPDYKKMMFNEFTEANKEIEEAYSLYWDTIGQLDMASCELVGQVTDLPSKHQCDLIELANTIRFARLKFQENINQVPNWNKLRVEIQKTQNILNKELGKN